MYMMRSCFVYQIVWALSASKVSICDHCLVVGYDREFTGYDWPFFSYVHSPSMRFSMKFRQKRWHVETLQSAALTSLLN